MDGMNVADGMDVLDRMDVSDRMDVAGCNDRPDGNNRPDHTQERVGHRFRFHRDGPGSRVGWGSLLIRSCRTGGVALRTSTPDTRSDTGRPRGGWSGSRLLPASPR